MCVDDGVYTVEVLDLHISTRESVMTMKCHDYDHATTVFDSIIDNLQNIKRGTRDISTLYLNLKSSACSLLLSL